MPEQRHREHARGKHQPQIIGPRLLKNQPEANDADGRKALLFPRRLDLEAASRRRAGCSASFGSSEHAFVGNPQAISVADSRRPASRP